MWDSVRRRRIQLLEKKHLVALAATGFWAVHGVLDKLALQQLTPKFALLIFWALANVTFPVLVLLIPGEYGRFTWVGAGWVALAEVASTIAAACYFTALSKADLTVVSGLTGAVPAVTVLLGCVLLGEQVSAKLISGVTLVTVGCWLITR
mgnify:CR=1 FL=1